MSILDRLKKASTIKDSGVLTESAFFDEKFYDSGIPALNLALSGKLGGGFTHGIVTLAGESKTGKTLFMHLCANQYLQNNKDSVYVFFDCEFGSNTDTFKSVGLDTDRVYHIPITDIEELKHEAMNQLKEINTDDNVIIGVDSFGEIASRKEVEDATSGKQAVDMTRAKQLNSYFRMVKPILNTKKIPHIGIGKTYDTQEMFSKKVLGGGQGITKQSDSILFITKSKLTEGSDKKHVGSSFNITVNKGRLVKEGMKTSIQIFNDNRGIYKYSSIFDIGLVTGHIKKVTAQLYEIPSIGEEVKGKRKILDTDEYMSQLCEEDSFKEAVEKLYKLQLLQAGDEDIEVNE